MEKTYQEIFRSIQSNKSKLPAAPDIGIKILSALNKPNGDVKQVVKIIENDAGLVAFIIKTARSVRFLTKNAPKDLESAVLRIGMRETYHLSIAFISRSVYSSPNREVLKHLREARKFSTKLAVISYFLAGNISRIPPSQALLAGLFQDIGVPVILVALEKYPDILNDEVKRKACIDALASLVGRLMVKQWGFDDLVDVVNSRKNWVMDSPKACLSDLILISRLHAMIGTNEFKECPPLHKLPAFTKFKFGELGPDNTLQVLQDAQQEIAEIEAMLSA